jgi:hypothetical protein
VDCGQDLKKKNLNKIEDLSVKGDVELLRRIDEVKNKRMKNVRMVEVLDKKRIRIVFENNDDIILKSQTEDYGYDSGIYIEKDSK